MVLNKRLKTLKEEGEEEMNNKNIIRDISCFLLVGIMLFSNVYVAFAASSPVQYATVYSHDYSYHNAAVSLTTGARAYVSVQNDDGTGGIDAGYMGGNAKLYNSNGIISKSTGMQYTDKYMVGMTWYTGYATWSGSYYAKSQVAFYNGNGYDKFDVNKSPSVNYSSSRISPVTERLVISEYRINENGEKYGSELYADVCGELPDLISAEGKNGEIGYVRNIDLNPEPKTIEEAIALNKITEIPLYSSDGKTVIGTFEFSRSTNYSGNRIVEMKNP